MGTLSDRYERAKRTRLQLSPRRRYRTPIDPTSVKRTVPESEFTTRRSFLANSPKHRSAFTTLERRPFESRDDERDQGYPQRKLEPLEEFPSRKQVNYADSRRDRYTFLPLRDGSFGHSRTHQQALSDVFSQEIPSKRLLFLYDSNLPKTDTPKKDSGKSLFRGFLSKFVFPLSPNKTEAQQEATKERPESYESPEMALAPHKTSPRKVPGAFHTPKASFDHELQLQELQRQLAAEKDATRSLKHDLSRKLVQVEAQYRTRFDHLQRDIKRLKQHELDSGRLVELERKVAHEQEEIKFKYDQSALTVLREKNRVEDLNKKIEEQTQDLDRRLRQLERMKQRRADRIRHKGRRETRRDDSSYDLVIEQENILDDLEATRQEYKLFLMSIRSEMSPASAQGDLLRSIDRDLEEGEPPRYASMALKISEYKEYFDSIRKKGVHRLQDDHSEESSAGVVRLLQKLGATLEKSHRQKRRRVEQLSNDINFVKFQMTTDKSRATRKRLAELYLEKHGILNELRHLVGHRILLRKLLNEVK